MSFSQSVHDVLVAVPQQPSSNMQGDIEYEKQQQIMNKPNEMMKITNLLQKNQIKQISKKVLLIIAICVIALCIFIQRQKKSQYLQLLLTNGKAIELPYLSNQLLTPKKISEKQIGNIEIANITQVRFYLSNFSSKLNLASSTFTNWINNNKTIDEAEYISLNQTYNMDKQVPEREICIVAPFRNLLKYGYNGSYHLFLKSINGQNYSNYIVYMIDDASNDNSSDVLLNQFKKYPRLNNRVRILRNRQPIGALGNRDSTTRNYCKTNSIVMDIDGDDAIIGKQVFNLYNRFYYFNPQAWFVYTNFIAVNGSQSGDGRGISLDMKRAQPGICEKIPEKLHKFSTYRTNVHWWVTSQLRSYLRDLYVKIPLDYVLQRQSGKYYLQASDRFTMYSLSELAGPSHTYFFPQFTYFYYLPNYRVLQKLDCVIAILFSCQAQARILTPLKPLKRLQDPGVPIQFYTIPPGTLKYYIQKKNSLIKCQQKLSGVQSVFSRTSSS